MDMTIQTVQLDEQREDVLREIGNIGGGHAITTLSQMLGDTIEMCVPVCQVVEKDSLGSLFDDRISLYAGVSMEFEGDLECMIVLLLKNEFTSFILKQIADENVADVSHMTDMQKSAVCEIGNIICNSYITALATLMDMPLDMSVPKMTVNTGAQVLQKFVSQYGEDEEKLLFVTTTFYCHEQELDSHILLHPTGKSLDEILNRLIG